MLVKILIGLAIASVIGMFVCMILVIIAVDKITKQALQDQRDRWKWLDDLKKDREDYV
jgi:hypothetical protein